MADQQYTKRLLSADSHVMEPRDLWEKRIDAKWRDKAPRIEMLDESGDYIVIDGMRPRPLAFEGPMAAGARQRGFVGCDASPVKGD